MNNVKTKLNNDSRSLLALARHGGVLVGLLALLFGGLQWLDSRYVDQRLFEANVAQQQREQAAAERNLVQLFESMELERERDMVMIYRAIRDASITGLVIRRDTLLARGRENLTPGELAELEVLQARLSDIAAADPRP